MTSLDDRCIELAQDFRKDGRNMIDSFPLEVIAESMARRGYDEQLGDLTAFSRGKKMQMARQLGHELSPQNKGFVARDENDHPCTYKTTTQARIQAAYHGVSYKASWDAQVDYLQNAKIACATHYFSRFSKGKIVEMWKMDGPVVFEVLLPKIQKLHTRWLMKNGRSVDNRCNVSLSAAEIVRHGIKLARVNKIWR